MKLSLIGFLMAVGVSLSPAAAHAQHYYACSPALQRPLGQAPDACGPGFYTWYPVCTIYGPTYAVYGPGYCLYPPFQPFQGFARPLGGTQNMGMAGGGGAMPSPASGPGQQPLVIFPSHQYARSPRDFYMWSEAQEELHTRERLGR